VGRGIAGCPYNPQMRSCWAFSFLPAILLMWCISGPRVSAQAVVAPLTLTPLPLPDGMVGSDYRFHFKVQGGQAPISWNLPIGKLPPGLALDRSRGIISGVARVPGDFRFTVEVSDYSLPVQKVRQDCTITIRAALTINWKHGPKVQDDRIDGSVVVSNYTGDDFDLTVIIVAVDQYGKAFALGYQKFTLVHLEIDQLIPFGSSLPRGHYTIHADAIAEVEEKNAIFRARVQTPMTVPVTYP